MSWSDTIRSQALALGFDAVGLAPARRAEHAEAFGRWLADGCHAGMGWLARAPEIRADPARLLAGARSLVCVGLACAAEAPPPEFRDDPLRGRVARFAWGPDYHDVIAPRLEELARFIARDLGQPLAWRAAVDSAPLLERDHAARAGLGWLGRNAMLLAPAHGPWLLLGELLLDIELDDYDAPAPPGCCAEQPCLAACPTGALAAPYRLDARRCISYLTIENKGAIPEALRPRMGRWIFGCEECLTACHWSVVSGHLSAVSCRQPEIRSPALPGSDREQQPASGGRSLQPAREPALRLTANSDRPSSAPQHSSHITQNFPLRFRPELAAPRLDEILALDERGFRERCAGTPLLRAGWRGLRRNAAVALGNGGAAGARPALERAAADPDALVREHAAWALRHLANNAGP